MSTLPKDLYVHAELACPIHFLRVAVDKVKGALGKSLGMVIFSL